MSKIFRILPIGPVGSGKSKLCNFIVKENKIVIEKSYPCSKGPEIFPTERNGLNLEIIDFTGYTNQIECDESNFETLLNKLKERNSLDLFLLVIKSNDVRFHSNTKDYLKLILNTFTPYEFFNHLAIIFTFFNESVKTELRKNIDIITMQLSQTLEELIGIKNNPNIILPKIYEIDSKLKKNEYFEKYQATIDVLLLNMEKNFEICGEIPVKDIKFNGVKERLEKEEIKFCQSKDENREIKIKELIQKYDINIRTFS